MPISPSFTLQTYSSSNKPSAATLKADIAQIATTFNAFEETAVTTDSVSTMTDKTLTSPVINTQVSGSAILDEDNMASDSAVKLATQQSIKAFVTSGTITMTNKTLTAPTITTPTITKPVMSATNPSAQTYTPSASGTATLDLSLSNQHRITMPAGNITIALSNDTNAQIFSVAITQDSGGSRTVTWFSTIKWAGGSAPTLTTTANKRDVFGFIRTGTGTYDGFVIGVNI